MIEPEEIEEKCSEDDCRYNSPEGCMLPGVGNCIYNDYDDEEPIDYY